uniref:Uncharacterized protein n=1 Tax=Noctiluca scintillans TaxID=2966 RepID=A0A7S1FGZ3_NOCSC|mmetsp:Transcript_60181/g.160188  ORF Transcript_60181/g.160188 Transcript_60181/m.160188 type:complete len:108 (+) Transcript_60181:78-401(+)
MHVTAVGATACALPSFISLDVRPSHASQAIIQDDEQRHTAAASFTNVRMWYLDPNDKNNAIRDRVLCNARTWLLDTCKTRRDTEVVSWAMRAHSFLTPLVPSSKKKK